MSFFKKLTDEFKNLKTDGKSSEEEEKPPPAPQEGNRGYGDNYGGQQYSGQSSGHDPSSYAPPPGNYGPPPATGPPEHYNQPYNQSQYGQPQQYGSGLPPPQPPRWIQQFDQASQRHYFIETTGRSQWEPPNDSYGGQRDVGGQAGGFYNQYGGAMPAQGTSYAAHQDNSKDYYGQVEKKEKDNDKRNMLLAAGAGVAVGGLAGAALAGDDSDDEHRAASAAAPAGDPYGYSAPAAPAANDSDAESLREAQQDYNDAVSAAAHSDASSDELEDLREAREEVQHEQEEYYED